jgi:GTP diphosphokinase / guanosine-3',5'-bis(diphosphate) 3'-diphosphatase
MRELERAIAIAAEGHAGQVDKAGEPYILHPLRVMLSCATQDERSRAIQMIESRVE